MSIQIFSVITLALWLPFNASAASVKDLNADLFRAIAKGDPNIVRALLQKGADVEVKDEDGMTPLIHAVRNKQFEIVKILVAKGANVNFATKGATPIFLAVSNGSTEIAKYLIAKGAKVNVRFEDTLGHIWTPLSIAATGGHLKTIEMLLENGADLEYTNNNKDTALMLVAKTSKLDAFKMLLDKGANINAKCESGETALIYAAYNGRLENVKLLLEHGADPTYWDNGALEVAERQGHAEVANLLRNFKFSRDSKTNKGNLLSGDSIRTNDSNHFICSKSIEAFDPNKPTQLTGYFQQGTSLIIGAKDVASGMILVIYNAPDGAVIRALCKPSDLGRSNE